MKRARNNTLFPMEVATAKLTIEIIRSVVLDHDLHLQVRSNELVDALISQTNRDRMGIQFRPLEQIDFRIDNVQARNDYKMNRWIGRLLD